MSAGRCGKADGEKGRTGRGIRSHVTPNRSVFRLRRLKTFCRHRIRRPGDRRRILRPADQPNPFSAGPH